MERKNVIAIVTAVVALLIVLYYLKKQAPATVQQAVSENPFAAPYTDWANGNYPSAGNLNGSNSPFQSIEVNVNIPSISRLSTDYIPVYGFTGVVAAG